MPRLDDPSEFAIIKRMYVKPRIEVDSIYELDPIEALERQTSRSKKITNHAK